jgi:hypothetical protein
MDIAGSYQAFSAAASMSAGHEAASTTRTTRVDVSIQAQKYSVQAKAALRLTPEKHLDPSVAEFIRQSAPRDLLKLGEFYAHQAILGGLFKKTYVAEMTRNDTASSIAAEIQAKYGVGMVGSCSASMSTSFETRSGTRNAKMKTAWHCEGGDAAIWLGCDGDNVRAIQTQWAATVRDDNLYTYDLKLIPMWELIRKVDEMKGVEFKALVEEMWAKNSLPLPTGYAEEGPDAEELISSGGAVYFRNPSHDNHFVECSSRAGAGYGMSTRDNKTCEWNGVATAKFTIHKWE